MSLAAFQPEKIEIKHRKVTFEVRGLSMTDLSSLVRTHYTDLEALFTIYENEAVTGGVNAMSIARYGTSLIKDAPGLVGHIIALAADEPEMVDNAMRLPMLVQIDALKAIGKLTFEEVGGVKKLIAELSNLVGQMAPQQRSQQAN